MAYVVSKSHRSSDKLKKMFLTELKNFYAIKNNSRFTGENIFQIPDNSYESALKIKGISKFSEKGKELFERWK